MKLLKKLLALIKWLITGVLWSYVYLFSTYWLFKSVWGFNYLSKSNWKLISNYWNAGGKIYTPKDYIFILCLFLLIPLWIWGWRKLYKKNWITFLLAPITWHQKRQAEKYMKGMSRIKIHNIGISVGDDIKQDFENKLQKQQSDIQNSPKASQNIRQDLKIKLKKHS